MSRSWRRSRDPGRVSVSRRGLSQSAGAAAPPRAASRGQARPAAHARPRLTGAPAPGAPNGNPAQDGTIITKRPDVMWGTDATRFYTERDGWCWFFGAIDHHLDEVVGWHTAKLGDRWAALEPIRQGVRHAFGRFGKDV